MCYPYIKTENNLSPFDEQLTNAIRHRFAPDIMADLKDSHVHGYTYPRTVIQVPVLATTKLLYDQNLAAFSVEGKVNNLNGKDCLMVRQFFTSHELVGARTSSNIINYLFDKLKHDFTHALVKGELKTILGSE